MEDGIGWGAGDAFELIEPDRHSSALIFNSPHSGSRYPGSFLKATRLDERAIRQSEDTYVDELFADARTVGAPMLRALFPRAWLDVNREAFELDPRMFKGTLPAFANTCSTRVAAGLGTVPRFVADGKAIYSGPIPVDEALARIADVYLPYHRQLQDLIERTHRMFGYAILIDCHSMPSSVRSSHLRGRPDFVLGDRHGSSCIAMLTDLAEAALVRRGYDVSRNRPYAGGFITEHYGRPSVGVHALQIEVNRALYLNERTLEKSRGFRKLCHDLSGLIGDLAEAAVDRAPSHREAAE